MVQKSVMQQVHETVMSDRLGRAKELKKQGRTVMGYVCCFVPLEMFTALDIVPVRMLGNCSENQSEADKHVENIMCSFIRSVFDVDLKGQYDFLDGLVVPHSCDSVCMTWGLWPFYRQRAFQYFLDVPHVVNETGEYLMVDALRRFKEKLEAYTGRPLTEEALRRAIQLHNRQRKLMERIYELRRRADLDVSGAEIKELLILTMSLPVEEGNALLEQAYEELSQRTGGAQEKPRIMVYGPAMDNDFIDLVESCGARVVVDDACLGTRFFASWVEESDEPYHALAKCYFMDSRCPRTYRRPDESTLPAGATYDYQEDIDLRLGHIGRYAKDWSADGVIMYVLRFCDSHGFDIPDVRDSLKRKRIPVLVLEGDYTLAKEQLKTRIQAFLETIDQ